MGSHTPHLTPLVHPGRTGLEGSPAGKSRGDPLKSALPLTPTHQKDKSKPLREEALKNHLLHLTCFADIKEKDTVPSIWGSHPLQKSCTVVLCVIHSKLP